MASKVTTTIWTNDMITELGFPTGLPVVGVASARILRKQRQERGANYQRPCKHWAGPCFTLTDRGRVYVAGGD